MASFSAGVTRVLSLAQEEARFLGHEVVESEHLLLALTRDTDAAGPRLAGHGIDIDNARHAVVAVRTRQPINRQERLHFAETARMAISRAIDVAGAAPVGTLHLLKGTLEQQSPTLRDVLRHLRDDRPNQERIAGL